MKQILLISVGIFVMVMLVGCGVDFTKKEKDFVMNEIEKVNDEEVKKVEEKKVEGKEKLFPYTINFTDFEEKPNYDFKYEETTQTLDKGFVLYSIHYLIYKYKSDLNLTDDFFEGLTIEIYQGKIFEESNDNGKAVYNQGFYSSNNKHIVISTNQSYQEFFNSLQHEFGHFFDYELMDIGDFNTFMFSRSFIKDLDYFKNYHEDIILKDKKDKYFYKGKEIFAREFASLYVLEDVYDKNYKELTDINEIEREILINTLKNNIKDKNKIKSGIFIPKNEIKNIDNVKYVKIFPLFMSLNYGYFVDKENENIIRLIPEERKNKTGENVYVFNKESERFKFDGRIFRLNGVEKVVKHIKDEGLYIPLEVFELEGSEIYFKRVNNEFEKGIRFYRKEFGETKIKTVIGNVGTVMG
ncbi:hypothetical protein [Virgibacillus sp. DJP39]|uniref:hypothetical protein n=1 Tax=Virgibacillus sp. DJP39 TaxID=3409790 RepID=UPI003BB7762F